MNADVTARKPAIHYYPQIRIPLYRVLHGLMKGMQPERYFIVLRFHAIFHRLREERP